MINFPQFMRNESNSISANDQSKGVEGYIYDGADGSQMAHWTCLADMHSAEHTHPYDEYMVVIKGEYVLIIGEERITLRDGDEYYIPAGLPHAGDSLAGTRTIHAFAGKRAKRRGE